jgi:aspartate carbamoyltransferase catalytic subunit
MIAPFRIDTTTPKHAISLLDWHSDDILSLFELADWIAAQPPAVLPNLVPGAVIGCCFYQNSTRTRLSFEVAARRIGGTSVGFADAATTRAGDFFAESLEDTIQVIGGYTDLLVLRHVDDDAGERAAAVSPVPVISAGTGEREHPTQGLLDAWTISRKLGSTEGASIGFVGDPACRATRSILIALCELGIAKAVFLPPPGCSVRLDEESVMAAHGVQSFEVDNARDLLREVDAVSMIPFELPDFHVPAARKDPDAAPLDERYVFDRRLLSTVGAHAHVVHTGPRTEELTADSTGLPNVHYFEGVRNGVALRAALICRLLGQA